MVSKNPKNAGRKKLHKDLNGRVDFRVSEDRKTGWVEKAKSEGKSLTAWLSSLADAA